MSIFCLDQFFQRKTSQVLPLLLSKHQNALIMRKKKRITLLPVICLLEALNQ